MTDIISDARLAEIRAIGLSALERGRPLIAIEVDDIRALLVRLDKAEAGWQADATTLAIVGLLYRVIDRLGGKSDILCIVGSWLDTMDDEWVLESLKEWLALPPPPES